MRFPPLSTVYLDVSEKDNPTVFAFLTTTATFRRRFKIKVSMIRCSQKVPGGCGQYLTGTSGVVQSFNYGGFYLAGLDYGICFRKEKGHCTTTLTTLGPSYTGCPDLYRLPVGQFSGSTGILGLDVGNMFCQLNIGFFPPFLSLASIPSPLTTVTHGPLTLWVQTLVDGLINFNSNRNCPSCSGFFQQFMHNSSHPIHNAVTLLLQSSAIRHLALFGTTVARHLSSTPAHGTNGTTPPQATSSPSRHPDNRPHHSVWPVQIRPDASRVTQLHASQSHSQSYIALRDAAHRHAALSTLPIASRNPTDIPITGLIIPCGLFRYTWMSYRLPYAMLPDAARCSTFTLPRCSTPTLPRCSAPDAAMLLEAPRSHASRMWLSATARTSAQHNSKDLAPRVHGSRKNVVPSTSPLGG
ncbi:hypothetical protein O3P69_009634 [Scylla paramamosain]|uniref:CUB domain-containing protein n=1 Tax=Scylla paramamosain TaxID=85552 RepID=A0AAW0SVT6_SCYPA